MSKKIELTNISEDSNGSKYVFASFLKENYVDKSLVIYTGTDDQVKEMIFSSNDYGVAEWENGKGIKDCQLWEEEDAAKDVSYLSRRYTTVLTSGNACDDYALDKIISDVLDYIEDKEFTEQIFGIVTKKNSSDKIQMSKFTFKVH